MCKTDSKLAWGTCWEIPLEGAARKKSQKLQNWIAKNPLLGEDTLDTLSAISDVFADTTNLEKKYGITAKRRDAVSLLECLDT